MSEPPIEYPNQSDYEQQEQAALRAAYNAGVEDAIKLFELELDSAGRRIWLKIRSLKKETP